MLHKTAKRNRYSINLSVGLSDNTQFKFLKARNFKFVVGVVCYYSVFPPMDEFGTSLQHTFVVVLVVGTQGCQKQSFQVLI